MRTRERAVLVHGIWMNGLEMGLLRQRIRACGFDCHRFHYDSLRLSPAQSAAQLHRFMGRLEAGIIHLVGHSLGGIVLLHLFSRFPGQQPGRVVMLGAGPRQRRRGASGAGRAPQDDARAKH